MEEKQTCDCLSDQEQDLAELFKALGHPVRLKMVYELKQLENCCCGTICKYFSHSQSTISQHISVLKDAGIIIAERDGNKSRFCLNHEVLARIEQSMTALAAKD